MIKIEDTEVVGWEHAIRGMRNAYESWQRSDSGYCATNGPDHCVSCPYVDNCNYDDRDILNKYIIGLNDLNLMKRLRNAGTDHRKFMRMIVVYVDITAARYWWAEMDTYCVGKVQNSCSTMHTIHKKEFTLEDFSYEHLINEPDFGYFERNVFSSLIGDLNKARNLYLETKDKKYWWQMIQLLPSSYNQKRTVMMNYEVLANIYKSRKNHKLDEWRDFCKWIESLPYSEIITGEETKIFEENN